MATSVSNLTRGFLDGLDGVLVKLLSSMDLFRVDLLDIVLGRNGVFDKSTADCTEAGADRSGGAIIDIFLDRLRQIGTCLDCMYG